MGNGERERFGELFVEHQRQVEGMCRQVLAQRRWALWVTADDLASEVWLRLWRKDAGKILEAANPSGRLVARASMRIRDVLYDYVGGVERRKGHWVKPPGRGGRQYFVPASVRRVRGMFERCGVPLSSTEAGRDLFTWFSAQDCGGLCVADVGDRLKGYGSAA